MSTPIPPTLGTPVTSRVFSWLEMAERAWGSEFRQPDHRIYVFSDGRGFDSTDMYETGFYHRGISQTWTADDTLNAASSGYPVDTMNKPETW